MYPALCNCILLLGGMLKLELCFGSHTCTHMQWHIEFLLVACEQAGGVQCGDSWLDTLRCHICMHRWIAWERGGCTSGDRLTLPLCTYNPSATFCFLESHPLSLVRICFSGSRHWCCLKDMIDCKEFEETVPLKSVPLVILIAEEGFSVM